MNIKFYLVFTLIAITTQARAASDYISQYKNNYFLACSKEMSQGADAVPLELAMSICSCAAASIVSAYNIEQLQSIDRDIPSNYKLLLPHSEKCTNSETPKYMQSHPEFLKKYIQQHPELLQ